MARRKPIQVFEHDRLRVEPGKLTETMRQTLETFYGSGKDFPFYSLGHKSILFNQYVGVIQVGQQIIEVLPKIDRDDSDKAKWQRVLLDMLTFTQTVSPRQFQDASLKVRHNSILDLYFDLFLDEVQALIRQGLIRRYQSAEGNLFALKGALVFNKHLQQNLVHRERFYTRHTTYSRQHLLHQVLYECLQLIMGLNENRHITEKVHRVLYDFPEQERIRITSTHFNRIPTGRKTEPYHKALNIAKMLLLNYRPDVRQGREPMLSLLFDMNDLWEKFVLKSIRQFGGAQIVKKEPRFAYWEGKGLGRKYLKPDILVTLLANERVVLDTKWKTPWNSKPNDADLRQLLAYSQFYQTKSAYLVYPAKGDLRNMEGQFTDEVFGGKASFQGAHGGVIRLNILDEKGRLNREVGRELLEAIGG